MAMKRREKVLLVAVFIALAIFLFDQLFYTPQHRRVLRLQEDVKAANNKLSELNLLSKGLETSEAEIALLEKELKGLTERTLRGDEFRAFLRHLARESDPLQMKIISITPFEEKITPSEEKKGTVSPDTRIVTVQLVLNSTFAKLDSYLKGVEGLPFLVQIESLQMERNEETQPLLKVILGLRMYIIPL